MRGHKWSIQMSSATGLTVKQLLQSLGLQKTAALKTLANFLERIAQLYEQGAEVRRIGQYVRNWRPKHYQDFETHPSLIKDFKIVSAFLFPSS